MSKKCISETIDEWYPEPLCREWFGAAPKWAIIWCNLMFIPDMLRTFTDYTLPPLPLLRPTLGHDILSFGGHLKFLDPVMLQNVLTAILILWGTFCMLKTPFQKQQKEYYNVKEHEMHVVGMMAWLSGWVFHYSGAFGYWQFRLSCFLYGYMMGVCLWPNLDHKDEANKFRGLLYISFLIGCLWGLVAAHNSPATVIDNWAYLFLWNLYYWGMVCAQATNVAVKAAKKD